MLKMADFSVAEAREKLKIWVTIKSHFSHATLLNIASTPNVIGFRFNLSKEVNISQLASTIEYIHQIAPTKKVMVDFGGIKKRITLSCEAVPFTCNQPFCFIKDTLPVLKNEIGLPCDVFDYISASSHKGDRVLISDGWQQLEIDHMGLESIHCHALHDGILHNQRGISVKGLYDSFKQDYSHDLKKMNELLQLCSVDAVALSFVDSAHTIEILRKEIPKRIELIAKIESISGLKNAYDIVLNADSIIIARGDLLVELSYYGYDLIEVERILINYCSLFQKPYIVATRVADSLEEQDRMTTEEIALLNYEISEYKSPFVIMLANETTIDEKRSLHNIEEVVKEATSLVSLHALYGRL